jgi:hypothetical protein
MISYFISKGRFKEGLKFWGLVGNSAIVTACWIVLTMFLAAVSIWEQDLREIFKFIVWSRLCLHLSQSTGPLVREGLEFSIISPVLDSSMGKWSLDRTLMRNFTRFYQK